MGKKTRVGREGFPEAQQAHCSHRAYTISVLLARREGQITGQKKTFTKDW